MDEYWIVKENKSGKIIAHCGDINDAIMMVGFDSYNRSYQKQRFIMDQVITITSTTDKQLPGQQGLPATREKLSPVEVSQQIRLPKEQAIPFNTK